MRSGESTRKLGVICGLSLLLVPDLAPRGFFSGYSGFPLSSKTNIFKFQFDLESDGHKFVSRNRLLSVILVKQSSNHSFFSTDVTRGYHRLSCKMHETYLFVEDAVKHKDK